MKKLLLSIGTFAVMVSPALAHTLLDGNGNPVLHDDGNGDPMSVQQAWGATGYQSKVVECDVAGTKTKCVLLATEPTNAELLAQLKELENLLLGLLAQLR